MVIMARVDITGPVPMVVDVNHYSSECICYDHSKYRMWTLVPELPRSLIQKRGHRTEEEAYAQAYAQLAQEHPWAMAFVGKSIVIPHGGR